MGRDGESKILFPTMKPLDMPKKENTKAEAAPAKAEEKPTEAAPAAKPARKTAARKKTTKASK